jgi:hypothetical protein
VLSGGQPFPGAIKTTLAKAEDSIGFHVYRANDPVANDSSVKIVWEDLTNKKLAIVYTSGVQVFVEKDQPSRKLNAALAQLAKELGGFVTSIHGNPALVLPQSVTFYEGQLKIAVYGDVSEGELLRVAASIT